MKTLINLLVCTIFCFTIISCKKEGKKYTTLPESVNFAFIDKNGKSLVTSLKDSVKVSYTENGVTKFQKLLVNKLYVFINNVGVDTTRTVSKYNGLVINDGKFMSQLSSRNSNPIHNFTIYLNGINMGNIYIDYWKYEDAYPKPSSEHLTFNNIPTVDDREYPTDGSNINLLQVQ